MNSDITNKMFDITYIKHQIIKSRKTVRDFSDLLENEAMTCQSKSYGTYMLRNIQS